MLRNLENKFLTKKINILLVLILFLGLFLRIYNINNTLGFYYDQGRDALEIWDLWHKFDLFLIGPTTGIAGIFRAPFYYYLIAPFYLIGKGNPIWPSVFLSFTTLLASFLGFFLGKKIHSNVAGIIMAILSAFSFNIVMASRWLSNPTPMLLLSMLLVSFMLLVMEKKKWGWYGISTVLGLSLFSFGSSGEVFYFLAIIIFAIFQRKNLPNKKQILIISVLFFLTLLPQIIFEFKNNFLLSRNITNFLVNERSFRSTTWVIVSGKIEFYKNVFGGLIFHGPSSKDKFVLNVVLILLVINFKKLIKLEGIKVLLLLLGSMMIGLFFFQGNEGNFYDYYLTGYYLIFLLYFSIGLGEIWTKNLLTKMLVILFLSLFLVNNFTVLKFKLSDKVEGPGSIALKTELQAVNYIKENTKNKEFNVDVYVPPVIPFAYDYLFKWKNVIQSDKQVPLLYTLYEGQPAESERLTLWLERQKGIGKVIESVSFGGITVQKRERLTNEQKD
jgi:4-amino-4-deoxy-L-arabinose transferase-like glycosyltransferase